MDDREYEKRCGRLSRALYKLVIWAEDHRVDFAGALENAYTRLHAENDQNVKDFFDRMDAYVKENKNPILAEKVDTWHSLYAVGGYSDAANAVAGYLNVPPSRWLHALRKRKKT